MDEVLLGDQGTLEFPQHLWIMSVVDSRPMFAVVQRFLFSVLAQIRLLVRGRGAIQSLSVFPPCSLQESSRWVPSIHQGFTDFLRGLSVGCAHHEDL